MPHLVQKFVPQEDILMSLDLYIYLGPFLKVKNKKIDGFEKRKTCSDNCKKRGIYDSPNFCPECGNKIEEIDYPIKVNAFNQREICDDLLEEKLTTAYFFDGGGEDKEFYLIRNVVRGDEPRDFSIETVNGCMMENIEKEKEVLWFKKAFSDEIEKVSKKCGKENVEVSWGYISGWY